VLEDGSVYYINAISGAVATEQDAAASETDGEAEGV
jgi:hypothetical protein